MIGEFGGGIQSGYLFVCFSFSLSLNFINVSELCSELQVHVVLIDSSVFFQAITSGQFL